MIKRASEIAQFFPYFQKFLSYVGRTNKYV